MRRSALPLLFLFCLTMTAGCGNDVADDPKLSETGKAIVEEVGGPFSESEFERFLADLPSIPGLTAGNREILDDDSEDGLPAQMKDAIKAKGWDEQRFLYIYGHTMTMVSTQQMGKAMAEMEAQLKDMPEDQKAMMEKMLKEQMGGSAEAMQSELDAQVPASEQAIIKDNMPKLHSLLGIN